MNLTSLTTGQFKQIIKLMKQKEALEARAAKIDAQLAAFEGGAAAKPAPVKPGRKPGRKVARAPRGAFKAEVVNALKAAGKSGLSVGELAKKLGVTSARMFNWFYATGKNVSQIKPAGKARYAWVG
jgi:hypothetical protein